MATRHVAGTNLVVLLAATAVAWVAIWRPMIVMRQVGIAGVLPESGRQCDDSPEFAVRHCHTFPSPSARRTGVEEQVSLMRRTRRITQAVRTWSGADSTEWARQRDSVWRGLARAGGHAITCPPSPGASDGVPSLAAWRFREQDVRVLAERLTGAEPPRWYVQVMGYPVGYSGCQSWVVERRWITPAAAVAQLWRMLEE